MEESNVFSEDELDKDKLLNELIMAILLRLYYPTSIIAKSKLTIEEVIRGR